MFGFLRRSAPRPVSDAVSRAIENVGLTSSASNPSSLRMVESGGQYSDRKVTYFRIFDPAVTAQHSLDIRRYRDLDAFQSLIVQSGHVERDGKVVVTRPVIVRAADAPIRTRAGRLVPTIPADGVLSDEAAASGNMTTVEIPGAGQTR